MRIRILPIIIIACLILLVLKAIDIVDRRQTFVEAFFVETLIAEEDKSDEGEKKAKEGEEEAKKEASDDEPIFTKTEVDLLQRLSTRREKLEKWQKDIEIKESILNITQTKIDQKIVELRTLKKEVEKILADYNKKEDQKILSLVKIYENMKAKNAADIFSELDMKTLMLVIIRMKEAKVALVLAKMNPKLAKKLTENLVLYRKLP